MAAANHMKVPLFTGNPATDGLTAEMFVDRLEAAEAVNGWNEGQVLGMFKASLRNGAASWFENLRHYPRLNLTVWNPNVKTLFLQRYKLQQTPVTAVGLLEGLNQKSNEDVQLFADRVQTAFRAMALLRPDFDTPAPDQQTTNAAYMALTAAQRREVRSFYNKFRDGSNLEFFTIQFFISGLRDTIRQRLVDRAPEGGYQDMLDCAKEARAIEMSMGQKALVDKAPAVVAAVDNENEEVAAFRGRGRGRGRGMARGGFRGRAAAPGRGGAQGGKFQGKCFNCGKLGHRQADCRSAPKVGEVKEGHAKDKEEDEEDEEDDQAGYYEQVETLGLAGFSQHLN